jgi:hypothetical protein
VNGKDDAFSAYKKKMAMSYRFRPNPLVRHTTITTTTTTYIITTTTTTTTFTTPRCIYSMPAMAAHVLTVYVFLRRTIRVLHIGRTAT